MKQAAAQAAQQAPVWTPNASAKECKVHLSPRLTSHLVCTSPTLHGVCACVGV